MMRRANSSPERADGGGLILKQSRRMSLVEAVANVVVGYGVLGTQLTADGSVAKVAPEPDADMVVVDPAGLKFIQACS